MRRFLFEPRRWARWGLIVGVMMVWLAVAAGPRHGAAPLYAFGACTNTAATDHPNANTVCVGENASPAFFFFRPTPLTVPAGTAVTWINVGAIKHNVVSDNGAFPSSPLLNAAGGAGSTYTFTFTTAGTYSYYCSLHASAGQSSANNQTGAIVVTPGAKADPAVTGVIHDPAHTNVTNGTVPAGTDVHVHATVGGSAGTPSGAVVFRRFASDDCTGGAADEPKTLSSGTATSSPFTIAGPLSYLVHYNGNGAYNAKDSPCLRLNAVKRNPTVTSSLQDPNHNDITNGTVDLGTAVHDHGFVAGPASIPVPTGDVVFKRFTTGDCTGASVDQTVTLAGGTAKTTPFTTNVAGLLSYLVHYNGDAIYNPADGPCEPLRVRAHPTVTSVIHNPTHTDVTNTTIDVGTPIHDHGFVTGPSGSPMATGGVVFSRFTTSDCTGTRAQEPVALAGGTAKTTPFTPLHVGPIAYRVQYAGDINYYPADGPCERLTVRVTYDSLCTVTRMFIVFDPVASALCATLQTAKAAAARGDGITKATALQAYKTQVAALTGTFLTPAQAANLIELANAL